MDLEWKIRTIDRLIKNSNGNATIADYFKIVDQNDKGPESLEVVLNSKGLLKQKVVTEITRLNGIRSEKIIK